MAETVLKNVKMYYKGYDLSGDMNNVTLANNVDILENTCFGSNSKKRIPGLKDVEITSAGYWNTSGGKPGVSSGLIDPVAFNAIGGSSDVVSVIPLGSTIGGIAYSAKSVAGEYTPSGSIGEMFGFNFAAYGNGDLVRGNSCTQDFSLPRMTTRFATSAGQAPYSISMPQFMLSQHPFRLPQRLEQMSG